jgi:hypothetical protein
MSNTLITGYEIWIYTGGKERPLRKRNDFFTPEELSKLNLKQGGQKHFWSFMVYNHDEQKFQAAIITQKTIMKAIQDIASNVEYGHPSGYDLTIKRKGEGLETEYTVMPSPPKTLPPHLLKQWETLKFDLDLIFQGKYPIDVDQNKLEIQIGDDIPFE